MVALLAAVGGLLSVCATEAGAAADDCGGDRHLCTRVSVPLDRSGGVPGTVSLHVERMVAEKATRPPVFVLVSELGVSNTGIEHSPANMLGTESRSRDVIVVDLRGTGRSGALRCPSLENGRRHDAAAGASCAAALGPRRAFYTAADSASDIEAVRQSLGAPRIALLGVAYGTHAAMEYARRYPAHVERLVLDSPVGPDGFDTLGRNSMRAAPRVLRGLCRRGRCRSSSLDIAADLARLAARLGRQPMHGAFVDRRGRKHRRSVDAAGLLEILAAGDLHYLVRLGLPAAIHDALRGDPAALLRLSERASEGHGFRKPREASAGAYAVALCEDALLPWPDGTPWAQRRSQAASFVTGLPAGTFGPFEPEAALGGAAIELCEQWPSSARTAPPAGAFPPVPTLLHASDWSIRSPVEDARAVSARIPGSRLLIERIIFADRGRDDSDADCPSRERGRFLAGGEPERCPAWLLAAPFPPSSKILRRTSSGGLGGRTGRTVAALRATLVAGITELGGELLSALIIRRDTGDDFYESTLRTGGLHGGSYAFGISRNLYVLRRASFARGIRISGWLTERDDTGHLARGSGRFRVGGPAAAHGTLTVRDGVMTGSLGRRKIRLRLLPPGQELYGFGDLGR